jgi:hypothetical protein
MARAQPKSSPTDQYAIQIAAALAKGHPPPYLAQLDLYCETSPREIFAAFAGTARHMPPAGRDEPLALGYLFVLQRLLEHLRYRTDSGYADAARLIADFQADVAARVEAGEIDATLLAFVGGALHQARIPTSPELAEAAANHQVDDSVMGEVPADIHSALAGVVETCGDDAFVAAGALSETAHALPADARTAMAVTLVASGRATARATGALFLLDGDVGVRRSVAEALARVASSLTPIDIRRLIAMRNWRPQDERAEVDAVTHKARAAGIACAQWEKGGIESILATPIDGTTAQAFMLVSPVRRKKRASAILTKVGLVEAWSADPEPRSRLDATLVMGLESGVEAVSRSYLDQMVGHHLALSVEQGQTPPIGLLHVAETIGGANWQPTRVDFRRALATLIAELPKRMREPAAHASLLRSSHKLPDIAVLAQSWSEDDPDATELVHRSRGGSREKLADYLLQTLLAQRRERWAEIFVRTALWMKEAPEETSLSWRELALVAQALLDGRDLGEIGLMREIALGTIAVLGRTGPA